MLRNLEEINGKVDFKAPLVLTAPTYNIIEELKEEGIELTTVPWIDKREDN